MHRAMELLYPSQRPSQQDKVTRGVRSPPLHISSLPWQGRKGWNVLWNFMRACDRHEWGAIYCSNSAVYHGLIILHSGKWKTTWRALSAYQSWNALRYEIRWMDELDASRPGPNPTQPMRLRGIESYKFDTKTLLNAGPGLFDFSL